MRDSTSVDQSETKYDLVFRLRPHSSLNLVLTSVEQLNGFYSGRLTSFPIRLFLANLVALRHF